jgi:mannose-6-phosphate isomerase-like protein (cupin superfamily)
MAVRRVVTGRTGDGTSRFVGDGPPPHTLRPDNQAGIEIVYVWSTDDVPTAPNQGMETTAQDQAFFPPAQGSRFLVITYPPGFGAADPLSSVHTDFDAMAAAATFENLLMHATTTIDYAVVLAGELTLLLDSDEQVVLRAGDVVVQNGTAHGWRNGSSETAVAAFVILGAQPSNGDTA